MNHQKFQDPLLNRLVGRPDWTVEEDENIEEIVRGAFKAGYDAGQESSLKILKLAFENNFKMAYDKSELTHKELNDIKFLCDQILLKVVDISTFEILCIVDNDSYFSSEKRKSAYNIVRDIKKSTYKDNSVSLTFSFVPKSENIDEALIAGDGYSLKYEPKSR